ncbi:MAG: AsmA-like C-terminal region-containing protein [Tenacibaculum sp.]
MKKFYKIILSIVLLIFVLLISIPLLFEDKIIDMLKQTINDNANAQVNFNDVNLSLLRNFPNASLKLSDIAIINHSPFKGDTLLYAQSVNLKLRLSDLFKSSTSQFKVKSIGIDNSKVNVLINKQGKANYDITKPPIEPSPNKQNKSSKNFGLLINSYAITNTTLIYNDKKGNINLLLNNFNHRGSGDFSKSNTELKTKTSAEVSLDINGTSYANKQKISLDANLAIDMLNKKFSFLKNQAQLNKLALVFDGFIKVNENNQQVSISFSTPKSSFKNFLDLTPQAYAKDISKVKTTGSFNIEGEINGIADNEHIPKINIAIKAQNASFKYPSLAKSVENININTHIKNTTGKPKNTFVTVDNLSFKIDQDSFTGKASIYNLTSNPLINANLNGTINLANISEVYPLSADKKLSGIVKTKLSTQFDIDAIKKNIVERIKNSGTIKVNNLVYKSNDFANAINIKNMDIDFNPKTVLLSKFNAETGKTDIKASGKINNLLGFLLSDKKLQGNFNIESNNFYLNDFTQNPQGNKKSEEKQTKQTQNEEAIKIPAFLNCKITAAAKTVYYDNLILKNVKSTLWLKDEKANLQNMTADIFNGQISLNGEVSTKDKQPSFAVNLGINSFDISQSFNSMNLLQSLSPIAQAMDGKLNSDISLSGNLNNNFTPKLETISGKALAQLLSAEINPEKNKALSLLNNKLAFIDLSKLNLKNIKTQLAFKDGGVEVKPFKVNYKDIGINIGGSHSFNQNVNYDIVFDVPAKYLGSEVSGLLAKLNAKNQNITVPVTATIKGALSSPKIQTDLASSATKLSQKLIEQQKNNLVNNTLNNFFGNSKKDSAQNSNNKDDIVKKASGILGGLLGKKKKKENNKK